MTPSDADRDALDSAGDRWRLETDLNGWTFIVVEGYRLPYGFSQSTVDLLLHLHPQFPDVPPDMFYVHPRVTLATTGAAPQASGTNLDALGFSWQRFSRHLAQGAWLPGDDLRTWLAAVRSLLRADVGVAA